MEACEDALVKSCRQLSPGMFEPPSGLAVQGDTTKVVEAKEDDVHVVDVEMAVGPRGATTVYEEELYSQRSKLYILVGKAWQEICIVDAKFLIEASSGKVQFCAVDHATMAAVVNHYVVEHPPLCTLHSNIGSDKTWVWTAQDDIDGCAAIRQMALKFGTTDLAQGLQAAFEDAKRRNTNVPEFAGHAYVGSAGLATESIPLLDDDEPAFEPPQSVCRTLILLVASAVMLIAAAWMLHCVHDVHAPNVDIILGLLGKGTDITRTQAVAALRRAGGNLDGAVVALLRGEVSQMDEDSALAATMVLWPVACLAATAVLSCIYAWPRSRAEGHPAPRSSTRALPATASRTVPPTVEAADDVLATECFIVVEPCAQPAESAADPSPEASAELCAEPSADPPEAPLELATLAVAIEAMEAKEGDHKLEKKKDEKEEMAFNMRDLEEKIACTLGAEEASELESLDALAEPRVELAAAAIEPCAETSDKHLNELPVKLSEPPRELAAQAEATEAVDAKENCKRELEVTPSDMGDEGPSESESLDAAVGPRAEPADATMELFPVEPGVILSFKMEGLSYDSVMADTALNTNLPNTFRAEVASAVGVPMSSESEHLTKDSIVVSCAVRPPADTTGTAIVGFVVDGSTLSEDCVAAVNGRPYVDGSAVFKKGSFSAELASPSEVLVVSFVVIEHCAEPTKAMAEPSSDAFAEPVAELAAELPEPPLERAAPVETIEVLDESDRGIRDVEEEDVAAGEDNDVESESEQASDTYNEDAEGETESCEKDDEVEENAWRLMRMRIRRHADSDAERLAKPACSVIEGVAPAAAACDKPEEVDAPAICEDGAAAFAADIVMLTLSSAEDVSVELAAEAGLAADASSELVVVAAAEEVVALLEPAATPPEELEEALPEVSLEPERAASEMSAAPQDSAQLITTELVAAALVAAAVREAALELFLEEGVVEEVSAPSPAASSEDVDEYYEKQEEDYWEEDNEEEDYESDWEEEEDHEEDEEDLEEAEIPRPEAAAEVATAAALEEEHVVAEDSLNEAKESLQLPPVAVEFRAEAQAFAAATFSQLHSDSTVAPPAPPSVALLVAAVPATPADSSATSRAASTLAASLVDSSVSAALSENSGAVSSVASQAAATRPDDASADSPRLAPALPRRTVPRWSAAERRESCASWQRLSLMSESPHEAAYDPGYGSDFEQVSEPASAASSHAPESADAEAPDVESVTSSGGAVHSPRWEDWDPKNEGEAVICEEGQDAEDIMAAALAAQLREHQAACLPGYTLPAAPAAAAGAEAADVDCLPRREADHEYCVSPGAAWDAPLSQREKFDRLLDVLDYFPKEDVNTRVFGTCGSWDTPLSRAEKAEYKLMQLGAFTAPQGGSCA